jgi:HD-GYP domain-containing protein (c-di-GMP phosphodiesterase class II)
VVARYGGDEFIILMPETGPEQAQVLAERLRQWLASDPMLSEHHITGSFGVASFPMHGFSIEDIIRVADAGMYVSKRSGGNRVSAAEEFAAGEEFAPQRQQISTYIEGFLQREHNGPEHLEELTSMLVKFCGGEEECNVPLLKQAIEVLSRAAESRELHTSGHGDLVARYTEILAKALQLPPEETGDLVYAARVHDVGKIFVPERILNKLGPLTEEEFFLVRMHARVGAEIVAILPNSGMMRQAIEHHHQRFDGSGYPDGAKGEQIPLWSRMVALADAYANMVTEHSLAPARTPEQALDEIAKMSGTRFDGMLVRMLMRGLKSERAGSAKEGF